MQLYIIYLVCCKAAWKRVKEVWERRKSREVETEEGNLLSVFGEKNVYFVDSYILEIGI